MKRTPLKRTGFLRRRTPLRARKTLCASGSPLKRTALRPRAKRRKSAKILDPKYLEFVRTQPCMVAGLAGHVCWGRVEAHHEDHHGRGRDNDYNAVPLCWKAHRDYAGSRHILGREQFERRYGVSFEAAIEGLNAEWEVRDFVEEVMPSA